MTANLKKEKRYLIAQLRELVDKRAFRLQGDFERKLSLFKRDAAEMKLEVDEGKEESEQDVEAQTYRLAAIVVLEQIFAHLVNDDDPEEPGEQESGSERGKRPVEG